MSLLTFITFALLWSAGLACGTLIWCASQFGSKPRLVSTQTRLLERVWFQTWGCLTLAVGLWFVGR